MRDEIRERIEAVRRGEVPEGYIKEHSIIYPADWGCLTQLSAVLIENKERNEGLKYNKDDVLSVSGEQGVINQIYLLGRSYAGESVAPYHVVETGDIVYTKSPLKRNPYGIIKQNRGAPGIVSTLYAVYHCENMMTGQYLENYFGIDTFLNNYLKPLVKRGAKNDMKVNNEDVLLGKIPLPPTDERIRINELIGEFSRVIALKQSLISEKYRLRRILMGKLLKHSRIRLPGFEGGITASETMATLVEAIDAGTSVNSIETELVQYSSDRPFVLKTSCVSNGAFIPSEIKEVTEQDYGRVSCPVKAGTLIVSRMNTPSLVGACAYCDSSKDNIFLPDRLWRVTLKTSVDGHWLNYLLNTSAYQDKLHLLASGTSNSMKNISKEDFLGLQIEVPSLEEQKAIAKVLMCLDQSIEALERELEQWQMKKKALMQLLLTGLVRVNA